jgi:uncharacterized membrane protein YraQ (UPF0718 family)
MAPKQNTNSIKQSFYKALKSFVSITPMLLAVILLIGLFQNYVTTDMLQKLFGYSTFTDMMLGTLFGAVSSGNPIMSYIIGEELLQNGVVLYAITAFILSWVTLGIVQLPAESSIFGIRFTIYKNLLTFLSTIAVAYFSVLTLQLLS